jgi:Ca-activated chloride channel family protein
MDPLRYAARPGATSRATDKELAWLRLRYKTPGTNASRLVETPLLRSQLQPKPSARLRWSAAVAAYADLLRGGSHMGGFGWNEVRDLAAGARGEDRWGHRAQFLELVDRARVLTGGTVPIAVSE